MTRHLLLAVPSLAAGGMYLAAVPPDWEWHPEVAAAAIALALFLLCRMSFGRRRSK